MVSSDAGFAPKFTPRQQEILALCAQGYSSQYIAELLHISYKSLDNHLHRIYEIFAVDPQKFDPKRYMVYWWYRKP